MIVSNFLARENLHSPSDIFRHFFCSTDFVFLGGGIETIYLMHHYVY